MKKSFSVLFVCLIFILSCSSLFLFFKTDKTNNSDGQTDINWSNITISCLGDSMTFRTGIENSYPKLLKRELGAKMVYNYGIGYSTCSVINECECHPDYPGRHFPMCERYTQIKESSNIIIVMCGYNDAGLAPLGTIDSTDKTTFYGAMNTMCKGLKEKYEDSYIVFMTCFKYNHVDISKDVNSFGELRMDYFSTAVKNVCKKYNIDIFDTFEELSFDTARDTLDKVHPNQEFVSSVWVPAIAQYIKTNYKQK